MGFKGLWKLKLIWNVAIVAVMINFNYSIKSTVCAALFINKGKNIVDYKFFSKADLAIIALIGKLIFVRFMSPDKILRPIC